MHSFMRRPAYTAGRMLCWLFVAVWPATSVLYADALTTLTQKICAVNGSSVPCPTGNPLAGPFANETTVALGTPGLDIQLNAGATSDSLSGIISASASATLDFWATTAGPVRPGVAEFSLHTDGDAGSGGFSAVVSVGGWASAFP